MKLFVSVTLSFALESMDKAAELGLKGNALILHSEVESYAEALALASKSVDGYVKDGLNFVSVAVLISVYPLVAA